MPAIGKVTMDSRDYEATLAKIKKQTNSAADSMSKSVGKVGGNVSKAGGVLSAFGSAAGSSFGAIGQAISAVAAGPMAILIAAFGALIALGTAVWDALTVSADEFAKQSAVASKSAQKQLEETRKQDAAAGEYLSRLQELSNAEDVGNSTKAETAQLLSLLEDRYGDLGAEIDTTTGKVTNLMEVEMRLNAERSKRLAQKNRAVADSQMNEAKAAYMKVKGDEWTTTESGAGKLFDVMKNNMPIEQLIAMMEQKAKTSTTESDITGYGDVAEKLRAVKESRDKARSAAYTGYETQEEADKALLGKQSAAASSQQKRDALRKQSRERRSDDDYSDLKDIDAKKANRRERLGQERTRQSVIEGALSSATADVAKAKQSGNKGMEADALKRQYDLEVQLEESKNRQYTIQRQIDTLDKARTEAYKKLTDQASFELQYNELIAAGELKKAAALKLEKQLKDQNLKLTDEEKKKLLEQQEALQHQGTAKKIAEANEELNLQRLLVAGNYDAYEAEKLRLEAKRQGKTLTEEEIKAQLELNKARGSLNLQKSQKQEFESLYDKALRASGRGKEADQTAALKRARESKGSDLTDAERDTTLKLLALTEKLNNLGQGPNLGDMSIKTNSLTARGGFQGGAVAPDKDRVNKAISDHTRRTNELLQEISRGMKNVFTV